LRCGLQTPCLRFALVVTFQLARLGTVPVLATPAGLPLAMPSFAWRTCPLFGIGGRKSPEKEGFEDRLLALAATRRGSALGFADFILQLFVALCQFGAAVAKVFLLLDFGIEAVCREL